MAALWSASDWERLSRKQLASIIEVEGLSEKVLGKALEQLHGERPKASGGAQEASASESTLQQLAALLKPRQRRGAGGEAARQRGVQGGKARGGTVGVQRGEPLTPAA